MKYRSPVILMFALLQGFCGLAQKTFSEGVMIYKVTLRAAEKSNDITGTYTFIVKGSKIKKELKLNNGYQDVVLLDCGKNKAYSLAIRNNRKYAIELSMDNIKQRQEPFDGYTIRNEQSSNSKIAGFAAYHGDVDYRNGTNMQVLYTKDWQPQQAVTFERFPNARFLPLYFSWQDENSTTMIFEAEKVEPGPVENAVFRIPPDYKIISNAEYKKLSE